MESRCDARAADADAGREITLRRGMAGFLVQLPALAEMFFFFLVCVVQNVYFLVVKGT